MLICYISNSKLLLNSDYIKTKRNKELEAKFFELLQVMHFIKIQFYKQELFKKLKIL